LILTVEYDANRTSLLSLFAYTNGVLCYNLAANFTTVGAVVANTNINLGFESRLNYCANLNYLKPGIYINNLEFKPLRGGKYVRTAANYAKLVSTANNYSVIKLRSKVLLKISNKCIATVGIVSDKKLTLSSINSRKKLNAGYSRRSGVRPTVRGVAMNPIDHPHGGGQGKTSGGRPSVTPWAEITKGKKTRRKISYGAFIMKR
jgi:large subunit ribosomal protein L2